MKLRGPLFTVILGLAFSVVALAQKTTTAPTSDNPPPTSSDNTSTLPSRPSEGAPSHGHPSETTTGRSPRDFGHGAETAGIAAGAVAAAAGIVAIIRSRQVVSSMKTLGPRVPRAFDMNNLHITGFVRDGWPIAVEYALAGRVSARCVITARHKRGQFPLPPTNGERRIVQAVIPKRLGFSKKPEAADYWLRLDASQLPVSVSGWPGLRIYAVAAGPNAVGSVAIDQVSFKPTDKPVRPAAGDIALFGFHSHSDFDSVLAEFQLVAPYQGRNYITTDESEPVRAVSEDEHVAGLRWQPHKAKLGDHLVRIVAWREIHRGADWVSAFSADMVAIEK